MTNLDFQARWNNLKNVNTRKNLFEATKNINVINFQQSTENIYKIWPNLYIVQKDILWYFNIAEDHRNSKNKAMVIKETTFKVF